MKKKNKTKQNCDVAATHQKALFQLHYGKSICCLSRVNMRVVLENYK